MQLKSVFYHSVVSCVLLFSCGNPRTAKKQATSLEQRTSPVKYAKRFAIVNRANYTLVYLFGNKANFDTTTTFVIYTDSSNVNDLPENGIHIKSPCKKVAALSSIYATLFYELGAIDQLAAIDNIDYINNPTILAKHASGHLKELSKGPELNLEQTIALNPDILFTFGMGDPYKDVDEKLLRTKIPVAVSLDHLEELPLARAEWIKFYAAFAGRKAMGDSIFNVVEKNYQALKLLAERSAKKPLVFSEIKYGDVWYMPGGKSFMARLIADANGKYLWDQNKNTGSLPLSFEQVYAAAKDADFWINLSVIKTKNELLSSEPRYAEFQAYKTGQLFNNNKVTNALGYSTYWETGMIHPDRILSDLIGILHPSLNSQIKNDLYYYQQIK